MIEFVQIDGQRAEIANGDFPGYFSVDSMAALIGENGSGKTRLLLNVAEALTGGSQIEDQGHWQGRDRNGRLIRGDTKYPPEDVGVLYYTPLPFRRRITPHPRCLDASSFSGQLTRSQSYEQYRNIAHRLGVETRLVGRLTYRHDVFRRLIVPRLLEADCELLNPAFESLRAERATEPAPRYYDADNTTADRFTQSIEAMIRGVLKDYGVEPLVALACLEHSARSLSQRSHAAKIFLDIFHIAKFAVKRESDISTQLLRSTKRFSDLIQTTESFLELSRYKGVDQIDDDERSGIEVEIDDRGSARRIGTRIGAFEIGWENLSSGLLALVEQFTRLELGLERFNKRGLKSVLVLIDEGDAYLHMDWQRQYILHLDHFLGVMKKSLRFDSLQVVLATHSPIISGDFPSSMVQRLGPGRRYQVKTFGSSLDSLVLETFGTPSIGEYAARKLQDLRDRFLTDDLQPIDHALINEIGDEGLRRAIVSGVEGRE